MTLLNYSGVLFSSIDHSVYECPDVFELDGKIILLLSTADKPFPGARGYVQYWVGTMSDDDAHCLISVANVLGRKQVWDERVDHCNHYFAQMLF